jgi:integrase
MVTTYQRVRITERLVSTARPAVVQGARREALYLDTEQPGFGLRVSASGESRSFFVHGRVAGKLVRFTFDPGARLGVAEARKKARSWIGKMADGVNPVQARREERVEARKAKARGITLRGAWELREATLKAKGRSQRTIDGDRYVLEKYLGDWLDRELLSITREEARRKHSAIAAGIAAGRFKKDEWRRRGEGFGGTTANRTFRVFRACWRRAARQHPEIGLCPTMNIDWLPEAKKKAPIGLDGLPALWKQIGAIKSGPRRDLWKTMLFTGLRRQSACEVLWEHLKIDRRTLHVPNPKGGEVRAFTMPLPAFLAETLKTRKDEDAKLESPWVFPSPGAESGHVEEPRDDALGITPHDCRRLFITVAESTDASPYAIKLLVNHALPRGDVTAGYMALDVERLRPVMEAIAAKMRAHCEGKTAPVVEIGPRRKGKKAGA